MKRALILLGLLAGALLAALLLRVRYLRAAEHGAAGGSGVVEGVDVNVTSRISARITKVNVREGDLVKQGDVLVELRCTEQEAAFDQAMAELAAAQANLRAAQANATSASQSASGGSQNIRAAKSKVAVLQAQEELARVDLTRNEQLVGSGALPESALDEARSRDLALLASNAASELLLLRGIGSESGGQGAVTASLAPRVMYNQRLKSPIYMLPGVLATLLLNVTAIVTAMGLARERETGTLEQVLVTPIRPAALLAGKCLPYTLFGMIDVLAILLLGNLVFDVPFRGSFSVIALGSFLYLFSTLGIGILIASFSASQQQAMLGAFGFVLPAMLLSGFMSPVGSMPAWLQPLTMLIPMRHYIEIMRGCLLKGAGIRDLATQLVALAVLGFGILAVSVTRFRKRLG